MPLVVPKLTFLELRGRRGRAREGEREEEIERRKLGLRYLMERWQENSGRL